MSDSFLNAARARARDAENADSPVMRHLSWFGARVGPSRFSAGPLQEVMRQEGAHVLAQGVPPRCMLPVVGLSVTLRDGTVVQLDAEEAYSTQRYAPFAWASMRSFLLEHVREMHVPPRADWDVSVTAGSMCGIDVVQRLILERGDAVLCEAYTFVASKDLFVAAGAELIPLAMDADGLLPSAVDDACEARLRAGRPLPKVLYTIPVGQNPTGSRLHPSRYAPIYAAARKYGLVIVEDDAYFYMQHRAHQPGSAVPGLSGLGPSFLSLDVDGRVVRLDTFSKLLAPGFRLAWITAPAPFVAKVDGVQYFSSQWACTLSMTIVSKLVRTPGWLLAHVTALQTSMRERCHALLAAAERHLSGAATWNTPQAGMFLWVELPSECEPRPLLDAMRRAGVAMVPGESCATAPPPAGRRHLRLTYVLDEADYDEGARKVCRVVTEMASGERT